MSPDTRDTIIAIIAVLGFMAACIAGVWRLWLKPFLVRELFEPVQEARKQVSENHHSNDQATVLDHLDDVKAGLDKLGAKVDRLDDKLDGHLIAAAGADGRRDARITEAERRLNRGGL